MKRKEVVSKNEKELIQLIQETRTKLQDLRIELRTKQASNVREIRGARKTLARALTTLRSKQLDQGETNE